MRVTKLIAACCLLLIGRAVTLAQEWQGITLMRSTRADVERVLGPSKTADQEASRHEFQGDSVLVIYSDGPCKGRPKGWASSWGAPRGTVVGISVSPNQEARPKLVDLRLDAGKYRKTAEGDDLNFVKYINDEEGIGYVVNEPLGLVDIIDYWPASRYNHLRCTGPADPDDGELRSRKFEAYSQIPPEEVRKRLDNLATQLTEERGAIGYIIVYKGNGVTAREANRRAKCARDYLVVGRGMRADRLVRRYGGRRAEFEIELWVRPPGARVPEPVFGKPDIKEVQAGDERRRGCKL
jgi:hypothetical protein